MNLEVAIIDFKVSNLFSVHSACQYSGLNSQITHDSSEILNASAVILPGVGAFGPAMERLNGLGLVPVIREFIETGKPFMGICLGMQLLMEESEEFGVEKGLGIIPGVVKKMPEGKSLEKKYKIPHIGWNKLKIIGANHGGWPVSPLKGFNGDEFVYFVHSFYVIPEQDEVVTTVTDYAGVVFCSSLIYKNIFACQFHPEKSGKDGLKIFKNFSKSIKNVNADIIK